MNNITYFKFIIFLYYNRLANDFDIRNSKDEQ